METSPASGNAWFTTAAGWLEDLQAATCPNVSQTNSFTINCYCKDEMSVVSRSWFESSYALFMFVITCSYLCDESSVSHPGDYNRREGGRRQKHPAVSDAQTKAAASQPDEVGADWTHALQGSSPEFCLNNHCDWLINCISMKIYLTWTIEPLIWKLNTDILLLISLPTGSTRGKSNDHSPPVHKKLIPRLINNPE